MMRGCSRSAWTRYARNYKHSRDETAPEPQACTRAKSNPRRRDVTCYVSKAGGLDALSATRDETAPEPQARTRAKSNPRRRDVTCYVSKAGRFKYTRGMRFAIVENPWVFLNAYLRPTRLRRNKLRLYVRVHGQSERFRRGPASQFAHRASIKTGNFRSFTLPRAGFRPGAPPPKRALLKIS
jgi:hypothetical protein